MPAARGPWSDDQGRLNYLDFQGSGMPLAGKGVRWTKPAPWWRLLWLGNPLTVRCQH